MSINESIIDGAVATMADENENGRLEFREFSDATTRTFSDFRNPINGQTFTHVEPIQSIEEVRTAYMGIYNRAPHKFPNGYEVPTDRQLLAFMETANRLVAASPAALRSVDDRLAALARTGNFVRDIAVATGDSVLEDVRALAVRALPAGSRERQ